VGSLHLNIAGSELHRDRRTTAVFRTWRIPFETGSVDLLRLSPVHAFRSTQLPEMVQALDFIISTDDPARGEYIGPA
jgi:hypothetical protein